MTHLTLLFRIRILPTLASIMFIFTRHGDGRPLMPRAALLCCAHACATTCTLSCCARFTHTESGHQ